MRNGLTVAWVTAVAAAAGSAAEKQPRARRGLRRASASPTLSTCRNCRASCADVTATAAPPADAAMERRRRPWTRTAQRVGSTWTRTVDADGGARQAVDAARAEAARRRLRRGAGRRPGRRPAARVQQEGYTLEDIAAATVATNRAHGVHPD